MRNAFIATMLELAERDPRVTLLVGDLGFGVVEPFARAFPRQFVNAGIAEQNMTGLAAGLALSGRVVFTYSIANFPTIRCLEQVRNDVCYHRANVKIVSVGGGFAYGPLGVTHHATEDLALLRALPNMTVLAPGDPYEAEMCTRAALDTEGPVYLRLARAGDPMVHADRPPFELGRAFQLADGDDVTMISTGGILPNVMEASDLLRARGLSVRVLSMPTVKPLDTDAVLRAARTTPAVVTVEDHSIIGGLGSAVAEVLMEADLDRIPRFRRIGSADHFASEVGSQEFMRAHHRLSPEAIAERTLACIKNPEVARR
jgi:transketolase